MCDWQVWCSPNHLRLGAGLSVHGWVGGTRNMIWRQFVEHADVLLVGSSLSCQFYYSEINIVKIVRKRLKSENSADFTMFLQCKLAADCKQSWGCKKVTWSRYSHVSLWYIYPSDSLLDPFLFFTLSRAEFPGGDDELVKAQMSLRLQRRDPLPVHSVFVFKQQLSSQVRSLLHKDVPH